MDMIASYFPATMCPAMKSIPPKSVEKSIRRTPSLIEIFYDPLRVIKDWSFRSVYWADTQPMMSRKIACQKDTTV